jgi:hypothetical protein
MGIADALFSVSTAKQWAQTIKDKCAAAGVAVTEWVSEFNDGNAITNIIGGLFSTMEETFYKALKGFFLEEAFGIYLTYLAKGFYQLERLGSQSTEGLVQFINDSPIEQEIEADEVIVGTPGAGTSSKTYRTVALPGYPLPRRIPAGGVAFIGVRATEAGESYNVPNLAITDLKTPKAGVRVSNPAPPGLTTWITKAGRREEDDGTVSPPLGLKGRCLARWAIKGAGSTADAYRFWAKAPVRGGNTSPVSRAEPASDYDPDIKNFRPNCVTVFIAGPAGPVTPADEADVTENFEKPLQRYPLGTKLFVRSCVGKNIDVEGIVYFYMKFQEADVQSAISEALALYAKDAVIGATVYRSKLDQTIHDSIAGAIRNVDLSMMPEDIPMGPGLVPTITMKLAFVGVPVQ